MLVYIVFSYVFQFCHNI